MTRRVGFEAVEIVEDAAATVVKALRSFRQRKLSSRTMEESRAQALLQRCDRPRND
jgi:hypothetical protein